MYKYFFYLINGKVLLVIANILLNGFSLSANKEGSLIVAGHINKFYLVMYTEGGYEVNAAFKELGTSANYTYRNWRGA